MRQIFFSFTILLASGSVADAEIIRYLCKVDGRYYPLRVSEALKQITWKELTYKATELEAGNQSICPRFGWRAERLHSSFDLCTAVEGSAMLKEKNIRIICNEK